MFGVGVDTLYAPQTPHCAVKTVKHVIPQTHNFFTLQRDPWMQGSPEEWGSRPLTHQLATTPEQGLWLHGGFGDFLQQE